MAHPSARAWNTIVSATIGAAVAEHRQSGRPATHEVGSWWVGAPRDQWQVLATAQVPRMRRAKEGRVTVLMGVIR